MQWQPPGLGCWVGSPLKARLGVWLHAASLCSLGEVNTLRMLTSQPPAGPQCNLRVPLREHLGARAWSRPEERPLGPQLPDPTHPLLASAQLLSPTCRPAPATRSPWSGGRTIALNPRSAAQSSARARSLGGRGQSLHRFGWSQCLEESNLRAQN